MPAGGFSLMRIFLSVAAAVLSCVTSVTSVSAAEDHLELRGQLYFDPAPARSFRPKRVPRLVSKDYVAHTTIDFSYPEAPAQEGSQSAARDARQLRDQRAWDIDLTDGAKLKIAYDKDTKLSLGVGMWKVKMGVSKKFGGPSRDAGDDGWTLPARHGRAAALGRDETLSSN